MDIVAKLEDKILYMDETITIGNIDIKTSAISRIIIRTTDSGPMVDDMALFLVLPDKLVVIPSEHTSFFDVVTQLNRDYPMNYNEFITAQICTKNQEFILWQKTTNSKTKTKP